MPHVFAAFDDAREPSLLYLLVQDFVLLGGLAIVELHSRHETGISVHGSIAADA